MVAAAAEWPWSSYRAMTGAMVPHPWLQTDWLLGRFGRVRGRARARFADFVRAGVGQPSIWQSLRGQIFLGGEDFVADLKAKVAGMMPLAEVPRAQRRPFAKSLAGYIADHPDDRQTGMALAYLSGDYSMKAIADAFGVHYVTVSRAVKAYEMCSCMVLRLSD